MTYWRRVSECIFPGVIDVPWLLHPGSVSWLLLTSHWIGRCSCNFGESIVCPPVFKKKSTTPLSEVIKWPHQKFFYFLWVKPGFFNRKIRKKSFYLFFLLKNKRRLARSPCCLCACVTSVMPQKWSQKRPVCVAVCVSPIISRQGLDENLRVATNAYAKMEQL